MNISELKPYPKNAKRHDKKQIQQVADSIKRFGFVQPIVIDRNKEIVIGHCRFEAAKLLGLTEVPTISVENLSKSEVNALRLADNKLNESAWDMNLVIEDLKELDSTLLDLTGFNQDLLIEIDEKDDLVPEVPKQPKTNALKNSSERGDLIMDLFGGSGSTLIASQKTERKARIMELEPGYCDVIVSRYVKYVNNPLITYNGKEITWQTSEDQQ